MSKLVINELNTTCSSFSAMYTISLALEDFNPYNILTLRKIFPLLGPIPGFYSYYFPLSGSNSVFSSYSSKYILEFFISVRIARIHQVYLYPCQFIDTIILSLALGYPICGFFAQYLDLNLAMI